LIKRFLLSLLMTVAATGCASPEETNETILEPAPPSFGAPVVEPLPLRIGFSFEPSVTEALYPIGISNGRAQYRVRLGSATRTAFDRVFSALFVEAEPVSRVPIIQEPLGQLDGIIRVGVAQVLVLIDAWVTYELTFLNPDGTQAGRWRVLGTSRAGYSAQRNLELERFPV